MLTKTGWSFISELRMAGAQYHDCKRFIEVNYKYNCGCSYFHEYCNLQEFKDNYADSIIDSAYYDESDCGVEDAYVDIVIEHECHECNNIHSRIYCDECTKPNGFEHITLYHGIAAYNAANINELGDYAERVYSIMQNPEWQLCCSTRPIGDIGVVIKGEVLCASNMDLYTEIDPDNGRRFFDGSRYRATHIVSHADELDSSIWSHDEIVTQHNVVRYVWVRSSADDMIKRYGQYIAYLFSMKYVEVDNALVL